MPKHVFCKEKQEANLTLTNLIPHIINNFILYRANYSEMFATMKEMSKKSRRNAARGDLCAFQSKTRIIGDGERICLPNIRVRSRRLVRPRKYLSGPYSSLLYATRWNIFAIRRSHASGMTPRATRRTIKEMTKSDQSARLHLLTAHF